MRHRVCFVDDDGDFEVPLFEEVFGDAFDLLTATDCEQLTAKLAARPGWAPELFVLDLYFPLAPPDYGAVAALKADPPGLTDDHAEVRAAYANSAAAGRRLGEVLSAWRQTPDGGLRLAERIARDFPGTPIVFYSRKATLADAVRCLAAPNVRGIERKPTGADDEETRRRTHAERDRLVARFGRAISGADADETRRLKDAARTIADLLAPDFEPGGS